MSLYAELKDEIDQVAAEEMAATTDHTQRTMLKASYVFAQFWETAVSAMLLRRRPCRWYTWAFVALTTSNTIIRIRGWILLNKAEEV